LDVARLRARVLAWYRTHRRDLPWRRTRDPYAIWISEVMLQQTRVDTVIPYYERFLVRWPTIASLASADPDDVRASWSGLGYYRRAKLMLDAAHAIMRDHGGEFPRAHEEIASLPGLGRYTAGAVASIAFDAPLPAVDGNVQRVLARLGGIEGDVTRGEANRSIWTIAEALARGEATGDLNQGLIELGALVCSPKNPSCEGCPLATDCRARADGTVHAIPAPKKRPARKSIEVTALVHVEGNTVLLERQPEEGLFANLWCLPMLEGRLDPDGIEDEAKRKYRWDVDEIVETADIEHVLTHRDLLMRVACVRGRIAELPSMRRAALDRLGELGVPTVTIRALRAGLPPPLLAMGRDTLAPIERRRRHR
jgi:A/G-specific adenine glycosylase